MANVETAIVNSNKVRVKLDPIKEALNLKVQIDSANITKTQHQKLLMLIGTNRNVFAKDASELGKTDLHYHNIETTNEAPVRSKRFQYSPKMQEVIETQIKNLKENDIIEESMSPYHSSVILVKKPNNTYRFVLDFRKLNEVTKKVSFSIPKIEEVVDTVGYSRAKMFSSLGLATCASGFHQVPLDEQSKHKTTFMTPQGQYQFKRLCFGLTNAPATFQMLMTKVLQELNWKVALIYIDDILVFSKNFDEHLEHLNLVFQKLKQAKLTLQPSKCHFAAKQVKYLGHIISEHGIQVDKSKTVAVSEYPIPKTVKQLRSFLGMCNYYRKFIQNYSKICSSLTTLLKKDVKFDWTTKQDDAFNTLKQKLTTAPILAFPDFEKEFFLSIDASDSAIDYVLGQKDHEGLEKVIAYGGRGLRDQEKRWHINHKEGPGTQNQNADALSRRDYPVDGQDKEYQSYDDLPTCQRLVHYKLKGRNISVTFEFGWENSIRIPEVLASDEAQVEILMRCYQQSNLYQLQRNCPDFKPIFDYKLKGLVPDEVQKARSLVAKAYHTKLLKAFCTIWFPRIQENFPGHNFIKQLCVPLSDAMT
ncbi:Hypothetical predicted protein [Mytilus galloprovincialis]|uniref:Reverse transcriptase domain-containing protein n=1 Tax=Mytilus galloprovincialis TaxID=29158 RepID=A0A8B6BLJ1_MYTGA|nr:Hypothetical predicted protein [Mytilus galloprovincialis]